MEMILNLTLNYSRLKLTLKPEDFELYSEPDSQHDPDPNHEDDPDPEHDPNPEH